MQAEAHYIYIQCYMVHAEKLPGMLHVGPLYPSAHWQVSLETQTPFAHEGSHTTEVKKSQEMTHMHTCTCIDRHAHYTYVYAYIHPLSEDNHALMITE